MQTLKHQSVLVVGGSRGLSLGVVEALAARDANLTIIARDSARLTDLKARLGVSVIGLVSAIRDSNVKHVVLLRRFFHVTSRPP